MPISEMAVTKSRNELSHSLQKPAINARSFKLAFIVILTVSLVAFTIQKLGPDFTEPLSGEAVVTILLLALLSTTASIFRKGLYNLVTSYHFAISVISTALFATVLGTFILQNAHPDDYTTNYGRLLTNLFRFLYLDDIFHSLWFNGLLVLMAISLSLVLVKRKVFNFKLSQLGFLFTHLGIIVILIGALLGAMFGEKGFIDLYEGHSANSMVIMKRGERTDKIKELGFDVKLNDFQVEYYETDYKVNIYNPAADMGKYEMVASHTVKNIKGEKKVAGTDISFKVVKDNTKSLNIPKEQVGKPPSHILKIKSEEREIPVTVGNTYDLKEGWRIGVLNFLPHFSYSIEEKKAISLSQEPVNPALQVRLIKEGSNQVIWLFAKMPDFAQIHKNQGADAPDIIYIYDSPHSKPSTPSLDLELISPRDTKNVTLQKDHPFYLNDSGIALVLKKEEDVKDYRSVLSVLDEGVERKKETVEVNAPLEYNGYLFYQSIYKPEDISYSGILVVKDPGLWLVWVGFGMLSLGVIYIFYIRPYILKVRQKSDLMRG